VPDEQDVPARPAADAPAQARANSAVRTSRRELCAITSLRCCLYLVDLNSPAIAVKRDTTAVASDRYWTVSDESEPLGSMPAVGAFHLNAIKTISDTKDTTRSINRSFLDILVPRTDTALLR
jgi:hypothetical protein